MVSHRLTLVVFKPTSSRPIILRRKLLTNSKLTEPMLLLESMMKPMSASAQSENEEKLFQNVLNLKTDNMSCVQCFFLSLKPRIG